MVWKVICRLAFDPINKMMQLRVWVFFFLKSDAASSNVKEPRLPGNPDSVMIKKIFDTDFFFFFLTLTSFVLSKATMSNLRGLNINQQLKRQLLFCQSQMSYVLHFTTNGKPWVSPPSGGVTLAFSGTQLLTWDPGAANATLHSPIQGSLEQKLYLYSKSKKKINRPTQGC